MKTIELSTATKPLSEYANELNNNGPIILTLNNKPVAALIALGDEGNWDEETLSLSLNPEFAKIISEAREEIRTGKTYSHEDIRREFDEE
jgi:PHD/YefM family antitoxin component YafN of YafNO toxin-antitoxin module